MQTQNNGAMAPPRQAAPAVNSRIEARLAGYAALLALALLGAGAAQAAFIGPYAVGNWTTNSTGGGSVDTSGAPASITVVGPDTGSDTFRQIDFTIAAVADGIWSFDWSYSSTDSPTFDGAGWLLNGAFSLLANVNGSSGSSGAINVQTGDVIGFRGYATDDAFGPGFLTVTNFDAPVPEPTALSLFALGAAGLAAAKRRRARSAHRTH